MAASTTTTTRKRTTAKPRSRPTPTAADEDAEIDEGLVTHTVAFKRDGEVEEHTFSARPQFGYKQMADSAKARKDGGLGAVLLFERFIRPSLLNNDGTPAKWEPSPQGGEFVAPDGETRPMSELPELLEFESGSSRRRWAALMDDDDELQIDLDEITGFYEALVEATAGRPTQRRS